MGTATTIRRSVYADRLRDFAAFAFGDEAAFGNRGRWGEFFRRRIGAGFDGRVILEVGCFDAALLGRVAARYPNTGFVGLDWKCKAVYDGAKRVAGLGLQNVALVRGRGQDVLKIFAEGEVAEAWVFHPDPCDRDVELKNRLIGEAFLGDVYKALRDGRSVLSLKTDHPGYYQWVLALFGLAEPAWFRAPRTSQGQGATPGPRLRARDLMRDDDLPAASDAIRRQFDVAMNSADYWGDPAAIAHTSGRCFAGEVTMFEERFLRRREPIYYFEVRKR